MNIYKWLRGLLKASAFTTVMFVMQACYGVPNTEQCEFVMSGHVTDKVTGQPLEGIDLQVRNTGALYGYVNAQADSTGYFELVHWGNCGDLSVFEIDVTDSEGNYNEFDTLVDSDSDLSSLSFKLERGY